MAWQTQPKVQKGDMGEKFVDRYIKDHGFIPYHAVFNGSHPFDRFCVTPDKQKIFIAEVKTKAKRSFYPDTGFDLHNYTEYCAVMKKYNIEFFIFFVDEMEQKIYGNYLIELKKPYSLAHNGKRLTYPLIEETKSGKKIIYFPYCKMRHICTLTPGESIALANFSNRNYPYHFELEYIPPKEAKVEMTDLPSGQKRLESFFH